jgi:UDP-N-acetylmuramoyl-tripeptide--D-alanyl-D-alanine ligase
LITNIGKAHLEGFGSLEGVKKAKGELFEFVAATDGVFFLNHDDYQLIDLVDSYPTCSYGTREPCQIRIRLTQSIPTLKVLWLNPGESGPISISSHLSGDYHLSNIGAAIAVGHHFGLDPDRVATGIESYVPDNMRSQWIDTGRNRVLLDAYNANPTSMEAAIRLVVSMDSQNCLLILGDMFELGTTSSKEHWELLSLIDKLGLEQVMLVGKEFDRFREEFPFMFFKTFELLQDFLKDFGPTDSLILVKGSRGMRMERVVPYL